MKSFPVPQILGHLCAMIRPYLNSAVVLNLVYLCLRAWHFPQCYEQRVGDDDQQPFVF